MRRWSQMTDREIIAYAKEHELYGLSRGEAQKMDGGYYSTVQRRDLADSIFVRQRTRWEKMTNAQIVKFAKDQEFLGLKPSEAQHRYPGFYSVVRQRNLGKRIFRSSKKPSGFWSGMSDEQLINYPKENGLSDLTITELRKRLPGYYGVLRDRGLVRRRLFVSAHRSFDQMTNRQLIEYGKEHGLFGLPPMVARERDSFYYLLILKRDLVDSVFTRKIRQWNKMTDKEIIAYGKTHSLFGLSPTVIMERDQGYYSVVRRRNLEKIVFNITQNRRKQRNWKNMSDDDLINYGKQMGLVHLNPKAAVSLDSGYYQEVLKRGLADGIFKRKQITLLGMQKFLSQNQSARTIASLVGTGYDADAARILIQRWPHRFPEFERLVRMLPKVIPRITSALGRLDLENLTNSAYEDWDIPLTEEAKKNLDDVLLRIGIEEYQPEFNEDPRETIRNIDAQRKRQTNPNVRKLFDRIKEHYQEIMRFAIPGYGRLAV